MAFCRNCGASLDQGAAFCASCGASTGTTANARVNAGAGAVAAATPATTSTGMQSNVAALLTYILGIVTAVIFLVIDPYKNDRFVRFHAFQSLFFGLAWIISRFANVHQ